MSLLCKKTAKQFSRCLKNWWPATEQQQNIVTYIRWRKQQFVISEVQRQKTTYFLFTITFRHELKALTPLTLWQRTPHPPNTAAFESQSSSLSHWCVHSSVQHDCGCEKGRKNKIEDRLQKSENCKESQAMRLYCSSVWTTSLHCFYESTCITVHSILPLHFTQTSTEEYWDMGQTLRGPQSVLLL